VIVDPGQSSHADNGVFEITADGSLYLGKNGAYPQQLGQGETPSGCAAAFRARSTITATFGHLSLQRIRHGKCSTTSEQVTLATS
jgi:hypothetical protein